MVCLLITLKAHKDLIKELRDNDILVPKIYQNFLHDYKVKVAPRTLERRLTAQSFYKLKQYTDNPKLRLRIVFLFKDISLLDGDIVRVLHDNGYDILCQKVVEIRRDLGL